MIKLYICQRGIPSMSITRYKNIRVAPDLVISRRYTTYLKVRLWPVYFSLVRHYPNHSVKIFKVHLKIIKGTRGPLDPMMKWKIR